MRSFTSTKPDFSAQRTLICSRLMSVSKFKPAQAGRVPSRRGQVLRSLTRRLPRFRLGWALGSGAVLAGRDPLEARMQFGAASQIPECAPDLRIDIHCETGFRRCERWTLTSSTHKPEATGLGLWMTRPSDNPKCRLQRRRIQCESSQFGRLASSLPKTQPLQTQGFARDFGSR
jgi:hypothetical protein